MLGASVGIATTGVAGPESQGGKAPGTVFVAVSAAGHDAVVRGLTLTGGRDEVRRQSVAAAVEALVSVVDM